jgi:hypothetical protein
MPHIIERAVSGRAKCRGCGARIAAAELRFGERVPNAYGDEGDETTLWYHVRCAALTRPEAFLEGAASATEVIDGRDALEREAQLGVAHRRLPRLRAAERAATGRATCRACKELIAKDTWRLALAYYEDGRFSPSGYIHAACTTGYFETVDVLARIRHFSPGLREEDLAQVHAALQ